MNPRPLFAALLSVAAAGAQALAAEPSGSHDNTCVYPDLRETCSTEADCAGNDYATLCVEHSAGDPTSRRCEIPCELGTGVALERQLSACATGETCVEGRATPSRRAFYCKASQFRVDLNLLDQCVTYHLQGLEPAFSDNACSLEANLTSLLDQNHDRTFDIFDLDLCVLAFLEQPVCDPATATCDADDLVPCSADAECGAGLYCDLARHSCQRDCGLIAPREPGFSALERQCSGNGKVCDLTRGRCVDIDVTQATCDVDADCPSGAYCFLGRCAPKCYRSVDCPSNGWFCTPNNRCRALPHPEADGGFVFDPQAYAIRFARDQLTVDPVSTSDRSALVILDLVTKKAVVGNPSVSFGYRLEMSYDLKQDTRCLRPFVDCAEPTQRTAGESEADCRARQDDCYIDDTEQWVTLDTPFGTVSALGGEALGAALDTAVADRLSPGVYTATLRAIFDNGDSDSIRVTYTKASPSGEYDGSLSISQGGADTPLNGKVPITFGIRLKVYDDQPKQWNTLLAEYHLAAGSGSGDDAGFIDITSGLLVHGQLHSETAFAFQAGGSKKAATEIPFVGLYSPAIRRMRLIGIIDIPADFCIAEDGDCRNDDTTQLKVRNPFARKVRRQIEFIGPFEEATGTFHGIYREKILGLTADYAVTLDGGFIMTQSLADGTPIGLTTDALLPANPAPVAYPSVATVLADVEQQIAAHCWQDTLPATNPTGSAYARARFSSEASFDAYLAGARRRGTATTYSALGRTTIFPTLRQFEDNVKEALAALGTANIAGQQAHLNVYDFLDDYVLPCDPSDPTPPPVCVDEHAVRCGLALYQKAILKSWVDQDQVEGSAENPVLGELDLFCPDTLELVGCPAAASGNPALFALQEHMRFWTDLVQVLKLDADTARSDAFLVLFRNEINPFLETAALSYKVDRLREAMARYDEVIALMVGPAAGKVIFNWPARAFKEAGYGWIEIMEAILIGRMDALADIVDIERRIFMGSSDADFAFAQHMMQHEYLMQIYLRTLQSKWQGELFRYRGEAATILGKGQAILNQLNPSKNAIGITPSQVFFENSNLLRANWLNYRDALVGADGEGGLMAEARDVVGSAVENLQNALGDLDTLESSLHDTRRELVTTLNDICGDPDPFSDGTNPTDPCQALLKQFNTYDEWARIRDCKLAQYFAAQGSLATDFLGKDYVLPKDCPKDNAFAASVECLNADGGPATNACADVVATFVSNTNWIAGGANNPDLIATPPTCKLTKTQPTISLNGVERPCVGGEVGGLLQEQAAIDRERRTVIGSMETLLKQIQNVYARLEEVRSEDEHLASVVEGLSIAATVVDSLLNLLDNMTDTAKDLSEIPNCVVIAGFSFGTSCVGNAAAKISGTTVKRIFGAVKTLMMVARDSMNTAAALEQFDHDLAVAAIEGKAELSAMVREIDGLIDQYNVLTQTSFNLTVAMDDARFRAREAVRLYNEDVTFVAEHLVGRETGNQLLGHAQVQEASNLFRDVLQQLYRMTMAFVHHYNVPPADAEVLIAASQSAVTLDEAQAFIDELSDFEAAYCGVSGLDCDYLNNTETLRVSLRETLFPNLRDIVDAHTGQVRTAGEQFHNLITQPPFLKRRVRANLLADQVELAFAIPLQALENTPDGNDRWLIDPLTCNHFIDARDPTDPTGPDMQDGSASQTGSVAVNVVGQNLDAPSRVVRYQLVRGATDFVRACDSESVVHEFGTLPTLEYPIRKHVVGYAPQHDEGSKSDPASYMTVSQPFTACVNTDEVQGSLDAGLCWRYFARDRSLAAPDWKIIIPLVVGGANMDSAWVLGEGLRADEAPVIEDIVIYFRYRSRPLAEN